MPGATQRSRPPAMPAASRRVRSIAWRRGQATPGEREVPEETAVALTYNGATQAVMMATPADLEDFAVGFSLTERLIGGIDDIASLDIVPLEDGIEARLWISESCNRRLTERRRLMAGPTGCGLCGVDSLAEVLPSLPRIDSPETIEADEVMAALRAVSQAQSLHRLTHAVHAAAFWAPRHGLVCLREDLGRHNAVDKLVGAMVRGSWEPGGGLMVVTSRVSVEIVQKAAILGVPALVAVSAPTALAVRVAEGAGLTLLAVARDDGFEILTQPDRIRLNGRAQAAPPIPS